MDATISPVLRFSAHRLQTSALAVILYTFVTQTHPPINELSKVMALGW